MTNHQQPSWRLLEISYLRGSSLGAHHLALLVHGRLATQCADSVAPELIRQTVIDRFYNGISPYEEFILRSTSNSSLLQKRIDKPSKIYERLIQKVQPKTIVKFDSFSGASATYIANLTGRLSLKTQILCLGDFHERTAHSDWFMHNVVSENASEFILPVPISTTSGLAELCEWGIMGDLIEVDIGQDSYSAWSDISSAHKLLRPGGVIFGRNNGVGPVVKLYAQLNEYQFKVDGEHWMINPA
ncbi:hypothetical protein Cgig2_004072 [Carnegiea gigantea]|uniref:Uncharacterized protein n=1 Tax=Carnegiea gigantea TaxID=171969 RepID=A0A9Q1KT99_9CARY|nr:hypothetical protein Cgig2_004072 [Carnegiea gigantea]